MHLGDHCVMSALWLCVNSLPHLHSFTPSKMRCGFKGAAFQYFPYAHITYFKARDVALRHKSAWVMPSIQ